MAEDLQTTLTCRGRTYMLREMTEADLVEVTAIEQLAHQYPWSHSHFATSIASSHRCLLLLHQGVIIAYIITSTAADEAELLNITVAADYQRQGLGRLLLNYISQSFNGSIQTLFLEVRASNHAAIALYHTLQFNEVGLRAGYYPANNGREDAVIMAKFLL